MGTKGDISVCTIVESHSSQGLAWQLKAILGFLGNHSFMMCEPMGNIYTMGPERTFEGSLSLLHSNIGCS